MQGNVFGDEPLGQAVGNALEIRECIEFLNGRTSDDLETVTITLAAHMIVLGGRARSIDHASKLAYEAVSKGEAAGRFRQMIRAQGGDERVMDNLDLLPRAAHTSDLLARASGCVTRCDAKLLGMASNTLGAGRNRVDDSIDPAVGLYLEKKAGDRVIKGERLCRIHWNDERRLNSAVPLIEQAYEIRPRPARRRPLIHAILKG